MNNFLSLRSDGKTFFFPGQRKTLDFYFFFLFWKQKFFFENKNFFASHAAISNFQAVCIYVSYLFIYAVGLFKKIFPYRRSMERYGNAQL